MVRDRFLLHRTGSLLTAFVMDQVNRLAFRKNNQHLPEIITVRKLREPALLDPAVKAIEGRERYIFLVGCPPWGEAEFVPRDANQPLEEALPEPLGGHLVSYLQLADPIRYRFAGQHRLPTSRVAVRHLGR